MCIKEKEFSFHSDKEGPVNLRPPRTPRAFLNLDWARICKGRVRPYPGSAL